MSKVFVWQTGPRGLIAAIWDRDMLEKRSQKIHGIVAKVELSPGEEDQSLRDLAIRYGACAPGQVDPAFQPAEIGFECF